MSRIRKGMRNQQVDSIRATIEDSNLQDYLSLLVLNNPHDIAQICTPPASLQIPDVKGKGKEATPEEVQAPLDFIYESLRRLCLDLNSPWMIQLQEQCTRSTCPQMKAGEWLYLCAAHAAASETECCAIDYIEHTLDAASALLNSSKYFPSRISIPSTSTKHFISIARRLYRVFSHAYYHVRFLFPFYKYRVQKENREQHLELFESCESETSLYSRFKKLSITYQLVPLDLLTVPASFDADLPTDPEVKGDSKIIQQRKDGEVEKEQKEAKVQEQEQVSSNLNT